MGLLATLGQQLEHGRVLGGLVHQRVLALGVEQDDGEALALSLVDHAGNGRRLAAAGRAQHTGVARQDRLLVRRDVDGERVVAGGDDSESEVAAQRQYVAALLRVEEEDRAVGEGSVPRG